ncbi:hypothetical protein RHGRI_016518 [Rhododendron griersonianum]|uniref:Uncharacterized protein n=1 Tax=Rhododendron griersonianum TaxID=479676 RepID=A0AAV6JUG2_9ERIC|nr:hypothetical protein RHGRI_016518 [Rhododendron griersonianum]
MVVSDNAPLTEVFYPSSESSLIVESPPESLHESMIFVTAALPDKNQILVACTYEKRFNFDPGGRKYIETPRRKEVHRDSKEEGSTSRDPKEEGSTPSS